MRTTLVNTVSDYNSGDEDMRLTIVELNEKIALLTSEKQQTVTKCSQLSLDVKKSKVNI